MTDTAAILAIQDEYEEETGIRPNAVQASWILDQTLEAESHREVPTEADLLADIRHSQEAFVASEEAEWCAAGLCDHYTCTEGQALMEWEHGRRARGLDT